MGRQGGVGSVVTKLRDGELRNCGSIPGRDNRLIPSTKAIKNISGTHPTSWGVNPTTCLLLVPQLTMNAAVPSLPHLPSLHTQRQLSFTMQFIKEMRISITTMENKMANGSPPLTQKLFIHMGCLE
jgi:hypothetical protein